MSIVDKLRRQQELDYAKHLEAIEKFKKSWLEEIPRIENRAIDGDGVNSISIDFEAKKSRLVMFLAEDESINVCTELDIIESKLNVALETAYSRYKLQNRSLWARIAEGIGGTVHRVIHTKRKT